MKPEILLGLLILLVTAIIAGVFLINREPAEEEEDPILRLTGEEYDAFFASMYDISNYSEEDFAHYRGLQTLVLKKNYKDAEDLTSYLNTAFSSGNTIETVYLGIDPYALYRACEKKEGEWEIQSEALLAQIDEYPDVLFEVLLPYPPITYWTSLSDDALAAAIGSYREIGESVLLRPNTSLHFIGGEEWLIANPGNFRKKFCEIGEGLANRIFLLTFCDKYYVVNAESFDEKLYLLEQYIYAQKEVPLENPDFSDTYFVYFGDSVMTYATDSTSIPGVVDGLSGSSSANISQGGCPASRDLKAAVSLERMVDAFLSCDVSAYDPETDFYRGIMKYKNDLESGKLKKKKLVFVLCLGLNDYFGAHPVSNSSDPSSIDNYAGALKNGISVLKENYPDARILIMTPSYTTLFEGGTQKADVQGGVLEDYVATAIDIAAQMGVECVDVYHDSGISEFTYTEYLALDGVHPNETGRYLLGRLLIEAMEQINE